MTFSEIKLNYKLCLVKCMYPICITSSNALFTFYKTEVQIIIYQSELQVVNSEINITNMSYKQRFLIYNLTTNERF